ncbi:MAG: glycoside hydrolase family 20 protein [Marinifilaceae bacterium]
MRNKSIIMYLFLLGAALFTSCAKQTQPEQITIIPQPQQVEYGKGEFKIEGPVGVSSNLTEESAKRLCNFMSAVIPCNYVGTDIAQKGGIKLILDQQAAEDVNAEGYSLLITPKEVIIRAVTEQGLFYGIQSLIQLAVNEQGALQGSIPAVEITDEPRFAYRGLHLDVSRCFVSADFVKRQIDMMAYYKLNRLHWHLTDGAGWRLEIKKYPALTEIAAWRPYPTWKEFWHQGRKYCRQTDEGAQGGYYTQDEARDIVAYAAERGIVVIPEIEMPGHSEEVLAVYPHLSCAGKPYTSSDFCIGNEETFTFLQDVLVEVMDIFPSDYIHIGGDEAAKTAWKSCPKCAARMKKEGLANVDELQSYMIHRMDTFLIGQGRKLIGWDEILEGGLAPGATVMSWRGTEGGIAAVKAGQYAVMTPGSHCYFDAYQDAPHTQPEAIGGYLPLSKVYSYEPIPDSLTVQEQALIQGVQANVWSEYILDEKHMEYMIYPRLLALSEVAWTQPEHKDWNNFHARALKEVEVLKSKGYNPFNLATEIGTRPESRDTVKHLAYGKKVTYNTNYNRHYAATKELALTDGLRGCWTYGDGRWQGFIGRGVDVVIDLDSVMPLTSIKAEFMQSRGPELWLPSEVIVSVSEDGENYTELSREGHDVSPQYEGLVIRSFGWEGNTQARYIRYVAKHSVARGWLFVDEIVVL